MAFLGKFKRIRESEVPVSHIHDFYLAFHKRMPEELDSSDLKAFVAYCRLRVVYGNVRFGGASDRDNTYGLLCMEFFLPTRVQTNINISSLFEWVQNSEFTPEDKALFTGEQLTDAQFEALKRSITDQGFAGWMGGCQIYALVVLCKRAQVTNQWIQKRLDLLRTEIGANPDFFPSDIISTFLHKHYVSSSTDWSDLFTRMIDHSQGTIVQKNIILQARFGGLTAYTSIVDAMAEFSDFPWDTARELFAKEWAEFQQLNEKVVNNPYFGFGDEIRMHGSTQYPHFFYLAKTLLVEFQGNMSMRGYAGNPNMTKREICDEMLKHYRKVHKMRTSSSIAKAVKAMADQVRTYKELLRENETDLKILEET